MTYTIVARDHAAGEIGIATQSHYFALGNIVPWLTSGVGAVATQSFVDPSYGPLGLEKLAQGSAAESALAELVSADAGRETRQVAILPVDGPGTAHTGSQCVKPAGHIVGDHHIAMGNMLASEQVWPAMSAAFMETSGTLAHRLLTSLEAGQSAGGDIRGMQASAIKVIKLRDTGQPWRDVVVDLRVDDHTDPVKELRRLYDLALAYDDIAAVLFAPDLLTGAGNATEVAQRDAENRLTAAISTLDTNQEARLWRAVLRAKYGDTAGAQSDIGLAYHSRPQLREFVRSLLDAGVLDKTTFHTLNSDGSQGFTDVR